MKVYHGTIKQYAERIQREGLKPIPAHRFKAIFDRNDPIELSDAPGESSARAHVTPDAKLASEYAKLRAEYAKSAKGQWINTGDFPELEKLATEIIPDASPVVVEFHLPIGWPLTIDIQDARGYVTPSIPASYVASIREVRQ
jgi:hypothetical protein